MAKEREISLRVNSNHPDFTNYPYSDIEQHYFTPVTPDPRYPETKGFEWRTRLTKNPNGNIWQSCIKFGQKSSGQREEVETIVDEGAFGTTNSDISRYACGSLQKRRYSVGDGLIVDKYPGHIQAEKEFKDHEDESTWRPPEWCEPSIDLPSNRKLADTPHKSLDSLRPAINAQELIDELREKFKNGGIITLSGMSASGKSHISRMITESLGGTYIEADHAHIPGQVANHDLPEVYDYNLVLKSALDLLKGKEAQFPVYNYATFKSESSRTLAPPKSKIVVVDGLYANSQMSKLDNSPINTRHAVMGTPLYVCVIRRMVRDTKIVRPDNSRSTTWNSEETLRYISEVAIPTYLKYSSDKADYYVA